MKRLLLILLASMAMGLTPVMAMPDGGGTAQRFESVAASATGGAGRITLSAGPSDAVFQIYSITGQLVKTVRVNADSHATIEMPKGFYVVKCNGQWSRKVIVK